jgi:hypothetical protein
LHPNFGYKNHVTAETATFLPSLVSLLFHKKRPVSRAFCKMIHIVIFSDYSLQMDTFLTPLVKKGTAGKGQAIPL